jgi:polyhydroxybutyrate depolymerase
MDPCWTCVTSGQACLEGDDAGVKIGVPETLSGWLRRDGCAEESDTTALPDGDPSDGTRSTMTQWRGCRAAVAHLRIEGGGHRWPNGFAYFGPERVGRVTRDYDGNARILEFIDANRRR